MQILSATCPGYYCVPWAYVCDGKRDCLSCYDEYPEQTCGQFRICSHMFKCKNSQSCIHLGDVCGGQNDCHSGDDEYLCSLKNQLCPSMCACLLFTISCYKVKNYLTFYTPQLPYHTVNIEHSTKEFTNNIILRLNSIVIFRANFNKLTSICETLPPLTHNLVIDVSFNLLKMISTGCFRNAPKLRQIKLNDNQIKVIRKKVFNCLSALILLYLSNNNLTFLSSNVLFVKHTLLILNLDGNNLADISPAMLNSLKVEYLLTDQYHLCCVLKQDTKCIVKSHRNRLYNKLLSGTSSEIPFSAICLAVLSLNVVSLIFQKVPGSGQNKNRAFRTMSIAINSSDIMYGLYLLVIMTANVYFDRSFSFYELNWEVSFLCFGAFIWSVLFAIFSPLSHAFVSFCRLMVVVNPMETEVKNPHFVSKIIYYVLSFVFMLIITFSIPVKMVCNSLLSKFCTRLVPSPKS